MQEITNPEFDRPADLQELGHQEIFKGVDLDPVIPLLQACPVRIIRKEEVIMHAGEASHCLHLILSGRFRVLLPDDVLTPVTTLDAGQSIGEMSIIDHQPVSASVVADSDSRVLVIEEDVLWALVERSHAIAYNLLVVLSQRMRYGNAIINKIKDLLNVYEYNATVDPLTTLYNRRWLDSMFSRIMQRCATNGEPLSALMIDIDFFKHYNDKHGHIAGDSALRAVSRTILENLRPKDMVVRYGGEEIFALLPGLDVDAAEVVAERLRLAISHAEVRPNIESILPPLTASVGIVQMQEGDSPEQLIHAADEALYRAKHAGRNIVKR
ncbi:MAG: GGDEF domain-containing protein [Gammaproteobacteria bacterium]